MNKIGKVVNVKTGKSFPLLHTHLKTIFVNVETCFRKVIEVSLSQNIVEANWTIVTSKVFRIVPPKKLHILLIKILLLANWVVFIQLEKVVKEVFLFFAEIKFGAKIYKKKQKLYKQHAHSGWLKKYKNKRVWKRKWRRFSALENPKVQTLS